MAATKRPHRTERAELLDEALKQTFPASDPIAVDIELARTGESSEAQVGRSAQVGTDR